VYIHDVTGDTTVSILRRLIEDSQDGLSPEVAKSVLQMHFSEADLARVTELASRCNQGTLTAEETLEYDGYVAADALISLWQSKARASLQIHPSAA
jgi:hypothetical protein